MDFSQGQFSNPPQFKNMAYGDVLGKTINQINPLQPVITWTMLSRQRSGLSTVIMQNKYSVNVIRRGWRAGSVCLSGYINLRLFA